MRAHRFVLALGAVLLLGAAAPAPAVDLPTPDQAFALAAHRFDDRGWKEPMHGEMVVPMRGGFALLMRGSAEDDCHYCKGDLAIAYFRPGAGGRWMRAGQWDRVYAGGGWGGNFEIEPIRLVLANPTIKLSDGFTSNGLLDGYASIVELAPTRPILRLDHVLTDCDSGGADLPPRTAFSIEGVITPLRDRPGVAIRYRGVAPPPAPGRPGGALFRSRPLDGPPGAVHQGLRRAVSRGRGGRPSGADGHFGGGPSVGKPKGSGPPPPA